MFLPIPNYRLFFVGIVVLFGMTPIVSRAQDAQPVNINFAFGVSALDARFEQVSKADVEKEISAELAKSCQQRFPFWTFQSKGNDLPRLDVRLSLKNSTWSMKVSFAHSPGKALKDRWSSVLYAPGDLDAQVLPKDREWTPTTKAAFESLISGENENEILTALEEFVPLGTQVAAVPHQMAAVLSLDYGKYEILSLSGFRIMYQWAGHGIVILHSTGTGAPNDFPPQAPRFKGIWVVHNAWDFGGRQEDASGHMGDLSGLQSLAFYLEQLNSPPPMTLPDAAPSVAP
jgi:hypothetical protein